MVNAPALLADLTRLLKRLEADLLARIEAEPALRQPLHDEWQGAREADRTAETFETWVDQVITQAAVHWLLSGVFLRFIEDNVLVERPWLAGPPDTGRLALARDRHERYFQLAPLESDREYLLAAFREAGSLPGLETFFDEAHNPVFRLGISGDAAMALRQFWQRVDPATGALVHDFTDPGWNTRFLGDLYQDLSEATRKRYALLQTPEFVESFILDRTLTPALREFGFRDLRMIDPTCGSGHFLLGGFERLVEQWMRHEPARNPRDIAQRALDGVAGVDLNPFAVAISRFRLLVAALKVSGVQRLAQAPDFRIHVAIGDSLLHGTRFGLSVTEDMFDEADTYAGTGLAHAYASEDLTEVNRILGRQYHAVVGNPPYIVVKDAALNAAYRERYASCHMKYSLGAPFTERFFELAVPAERHGRAGYVGLITTNSFMKREFGAKLIEQVLPRLDLTHVIDTSGAYIPGHGTPTVILLGRHRPPDGDLRSPHNTVRAVMGIKGEPSTPDDPAQGLVWSAIVGQIDQAGSESEFVSVVDAPRATFGRHPWSIGGGGATELLESLNDGAAGTLGALTTAIGRTTHTGEDNVFFVPRPWVLRIASAGLAVGLIEGEAVRDYSLDVVTQVLFPYDLRTCAVLNDLPVSLWRHFWLFRRLLKERSDYGNNIEDRGLRWYEHSMFFPERFKTALGIAFAEVATHNHFVLDRGGKVFKQTAPVIKLKDGSTEDDHLGLLGLLNSSVACFWFKQVGHCKGNGGINGGIAADLWEKFYVYNSTVVAEFPLCTAQPIEVATRLDTQARQLTALQPAALLAAGPVPTRSSLDAARQQATQLRRLMIARQEELDWQCYRLYGLLPAGVSMDDIEHHPPVEVALGERAFEIVLARRMAAGKEQTTWFERHGSSPVTEIPPHWPEAYRRVVARRIELIETDKSIGLIERPEYKRRWNSPRWEDLEQAALRDWLLDRLEDPALWPASADQPPQITTASKLADAVRTDPGFMQIAELYAGHAGFDVAQVVADLVAAESVPFLPVLRYSETGLRKRAQWEATWALQRREDTIDAEVLRDDAPIWRYELTEQARAEHKLPPGEPLTAQATEWLEARLAQEIARHQRARKAEEVGSIPVPPKYQSKDFLKADFWRLRGGLDVPKERWVSYPGCERGADPSMVIAWAGWNHLQQATAVAAYYLAAKDSEGWPRERLQPLLAGLLELLPWLEQWHNDVDPVYGERMGNYYRGFVSEEARQLGFTLEDLQRWAPPATATRRGRPKKAEAA
jgi:hypothetical protein